MVPITSVLLSYLWPPSTDVLPYLPYQALICGALPVVVGNGYEVDRTFEFEGSVPPLVFANDYPTG